jgi:hypothetical protein
MQGKKQLIEKWLKEDKVKRQTENDSIQIFFFAA